MRKTLKRAAASLGALCVLLVVGEIAVRLSGFHAAPPAPRKPQNLTLPDETLKYRLRPRAHDEVVYELDGEEVRVGYEISRQGLRDREFERAKPAGTLRIAALGDSFTFGSGIALEETWVKQLERVLDAALPDVTVEVLNFGASGYNTEQEVEVLEREALRFAPDLVLLCYYFNDIIPLEWPSGNPPREAGWEDAVLGTLGLGNGNGLDDPTTPRLGPLVARARRASRLAEFTCEVLQERLGGRITARHYAGLFEHPDAWSILRASFARGAALAREHDTPLEVVLYPPLGGVRSGGALDGSYDRVVELCAELGLGTHDLRAPLHDAASKAFWAHPRDRHPNGAANALVAEFLAARLAPALRAH